jgi:hypothetical protein
MLSATEDEAVGREEVGGEEGVERSQGAVIVIEEMEE